MFSETLSRVEVSENGGSAFYKGGFRPFSLLRSEGEVSSALDRISVETEDEKGKKSMRF